MAANNVGIYINTIIIIIYGIFCMIIGTIIIYSNVVSIFAQRPANLQRDFTYYFSKTILIWYKPSTSYSSQDSFQKWLKHKHTCCMQHVWRVQFSISFLQFSIHRKRNVLVLTQNFRTIQIARLEVFAL